jgi:hypothetical protein
VFAASPLVFAIAMMAICIAALLRGDWEERGFGAIYLGACIASLAVEERPWTGPQGAIVAIDALVLVAAVAIAVVSGKLWPIGAAAFQVLTLGAHLAFIAAQGRLGAVGYLTVLVVWSYGTIACLACGAGSPFRLPWRFGPGSLGRSPAMARDAPRTAAKDEALGL